MSATPPAHWTPPPGWNHPASEWPWPYWERTCPGCGRYHRFYLIRSDDFQCAHCDWRGRFAAVKGAA